MNDKKEGAVLKSANDALMQMVAARIVKQEAEEFLSLDVSHKSLRVRRRFKIKSNRTFRELFKDCPLPYPEVDNAYERLRSKIVAKYRSRKSKNA